jgi:hypothetical protein
MYKDNILKIGLTLALVYSFVCPNLSYGRMKEKAITYSSTTGHTHDGGTGGKVIDSVNVINTPAGNIVATDTQAAIDELDTEKIATSEKGAVNGVASLDGSAEVLAIQLPAIAITDVNVCASQVCQLALIAEEGDVCIRSDENKSYIHNGGIVGDMTDWNVLLSTGLVTSVNGGTGDIINVEVTTARQTTITDSDSNYPTSGAVVDYTASEISTHTSNADAHHSSTSSGISIVPDKVTVTKLAEETIALEVKVSGDSFNRGVMEGWGRILWGDGTNPVDTNLYRLSANSLQSDDRMSAYEFYANTAGFRADGIGSASFYSQDNTGGTTGDFIYSDLSGESWARFILRNDGYMSWSGGSATQDTNLYRSSTNELKTDDDFIVDGTGGITLGAGDLNISTTKGITWGDTDLLRGGANLLKTNDTFEALNFETTNGSYFAETSSVTTAFGAKVTGDSVWRYVVDTDGKINWGPGNATRDVNLYRGGANLLRTDDNFMAVGGTITLGSDTSLSRSTSTRITTPDQLSSDIGFRSTTPSSSWVHTSTTKYLAVSAASMQGYGSQPITVEYRWVTPSIADSADDAGQMTIFIPNGVSVSALTAYGSTTASVNSQVRILLDRITLTSASSLNMADCTFNNGATSCTDSSIGGSPTDTSTYAYLLRVWIRAPSAISDTKLYNVRITYAPSNMSQTL